VAESANMITVFNNRHYNKRSNNSIDMVIIGTTPGVALTKAMITNVHNITMPPRTAMFIHCVGQSISIRAHHSTALL
jgi:hypothetical protein